MIKAALVEVTGTLSGSIPNVVVFQFNPETLRHTWSQPTPAEDNDGANPFAVTGAPGETFTFTLSMDVTDALHDPDDSVRAAAIENGIAARLAALELLLFPVSDDSPLDLLASLAGVFRPTPSAQVPVVLFVWGAGRILPVRLTTLTITEKLYDADLNPTHADAELELTVLTPSQLDHLPPDVKTLAQGAYGYTHGRRRRLAITDLGDAARTTISLLTDTVTGG